VIKEFRKLGKICIIRAVLLAEVTTQRRRFSFKSKTDA